MRPTHLVFVYGSLKRGFRHAGVIRTAVRVGVASAEPFALVCYGDYPALVPAEQGTVHGELVLVDDSLLAALDRFEDCPRLYQRTIIRLTDERRAFAYTIHRKTAEGLVRLPDGVWRKTARVPQRLFSGRNSRSE